MGSTDKLYEEISRLKELRSKWLAESRRYKKAYQILMDWFDYIPEEDREEVSNQLEEINC